MLQYSAYKIPELTRLNLGMGAFWLPGTCISKEEGTIDRQVMAWSPDSLGRMIDIDKVLLSASYGAGFVVSALGNNAAMDACGGDLLRVHGTL